jgi:hypothetical protein
MTGVDSVTLVNEWVKSDLAGAVFTDADRREFLDDVDELEDHLVTWDRDLADCVTMLSGLSVTVYRRRQGDVRSYFVRVDDTLYCIGVGKRDTTYDRDLDQIVVRAEEIEPD